jgi:DNA replication protein DnaC
VALASGAVVETVVTRRADCPWPDRACWHCEGHGYVVERTRREPEPHIERTDCRPCRDRQRARRLLERSGLHALCGATSCPVLASDLEAECPKHARWQRGCELRHTFGLAERDAANKRTLAALEAWTPDPGARWLYLYPDGDASNPLGCGTGKSFALHCVVHAATARGGSVLLERVSDYLQAVRSSYDKESGTTEAAVVRARQTAGLLCWDDLGTESGEPGWAGERLFQVLDERLASGRPVAIASNYGLGQALERYGDQGMRMFSRLRVRTDLLVLGGRDRRGRL